MCSDLAEIWHNFKSNADVSAKDALVEYYLPFVRNLAIGILRKLRQGVDLDDLVSDGVLGLLRALDAFRPERGVKFETYATPVVRGAIYNGLRALDWVPERTREKARTLQKVMDQFSVLHGRSGTEEELAQALQVSSREVYELITDLGCMYLLSLEQPLLVGDEESGNIVDILEDDNAVDPFVQIEFTEQREILKNAVALLSERERDVVQMHYFEGLSFEKIANILGVSKQRISQIHSKIVKRLKEELTGWQPLSGTYEEHYSIFDHRV